MTASSSIVIATQTLLKLLEALMRKDELAEIINCQCSLRKWVKGDSFREICCEKV
jgi:hypothetical protein